MPYASVAVPIRQQGTDADANGSFSLNGLPPGRYQLAINAVGYAPARLTVMLPASQALTYHLQKAAASVEEVVVTCVSRRTEIRRSPVPIMALGQREIHLNANANVIDAAVRGVPGLTAVTTGSNISKLFIRGLG